MTIMAKKYLYILSTEYIISTQYQLLVSPSPVSGSRASTYWVFWYYADTGDRQCANYCIVVFSIVAFLLLCIIFCGCLKCYFIRQRYKEDEKYSGDTSIENALATLWPDQARKDQEEAAELYKRRLNEQYPPLNRPSSPSSSPAASPLTSNNPPPSYDDAARVDEPNYFHNLRRRSPYQATKQANLYSKERPPFEVPPPPDHMKYIRSVGVRAWKFSDENLIRAKIIKILNDRGTKIKFNMKLDAMIQTNYPLLKLYEFNDKLTDDNVNYENSSSDSGSNNNLNLNNDDHIIVTKPSQAYLLGGSSSQNPDLRAAPPPYESPSSPTDSWSPRFGDWFYYYEVTVLSNPNKATTIAIGLATKPYPNYRLPGWNIHSVGYHSVDGKKYHNEIFTNREYGERWGSEGDIVGCGYYPNTGYVFFTKNGKFQGIAFTGLIHVWYPTIGSDDECTLEVNLGDEKDFMYQEAIGMSVCGPIINNRIISDENESRKIKDEKINNY